MRLLQQALPITLVLEWIFRRYPSLNGGSQNECYFYTTPPRTPTPPKHRDNVKNRGKPKGILS